MLLLAQQQQQSAHTHSTESGRPSKQHRPPNSRSHILLNNNKRHILTALSPAYRQNNTVRPTAGPTSCSTTTTNGTYSQHWVRQAVKTTPSAQQQVPHLAQQQQQTAHTHSTESGRPSKQHRPPNSRSHILLNNNNKRHILTALSPAGRQNNTVRPTAGPTSCSTTTTNGTYSQH